MTVPFVIFKLEKGNEKLRKAAELYTYIYTCIGLAEQFCRFACESESRILKKFLGFTDSFWRKAVRKMFTFMDSEFPIRQGDRHFLRIHLEFCKGALR